MATEVKRMKVKNISGKKIEIAGYRICAGHTLELKGGEDVSQYITAGIIEEVEE